MSFEKCFWHKRVSQRLFEVVGDNNFLYDWLCKVVPRLMIGKGDLRAVMWLLQEMELPILKSETIKIANGEVNSLRKEFVDQVYTRLHFEKFDLEYSVFVTTNCFISKTEVLKDQTLESRRKQQLVMFAAILWRMRELTNTKQNKISSGDSVERR